MRAKIAVTAVLHIEAEAIQVQKEAIQVQKNLWTWIAPPHIDTPRTQPPMILKVRFKASVRAKTAVIAEPRSSGLSREDMFHVNWGLSYYHSASEIQGLHVLREGENCSECRAATVVVFSQEVCSGDRPKLSRDPPSPPSTPPWTLPDSWPVNPPVFVWKIWYFQGKTVHPSPPQRVASSLTLSPNYQALAYRLDFAKFSAT